MAKNEKPEQLEMVFKVGTGLLRNLQRLNYKPWNAVAEWVDNSIQSYVNNEKALKKKYKKNNEIFTINIDYSSKDSILSIADNAGGMDRDLLEKAMEMGNPDPTISRGLSEFNIGLKSAAIWMGQNWSIRTKHFKEKEEHFLKIDNEELFKGNINLDWETKEVDDDSSYTILELTNHARKWGGSTLPKIKSTLASTYRKFIMNEDVKILWNQEELVWEDFVLAEKEQGGIYKEIFDWEETKVGSDILPAANGFMGVLEPSFNLPQEKRNKGSGRPNAGITIFRNDRMIEGYPDPWRPENIFGLNRNDLINQRLYGEIHINDASISSDKSELDYWQMELIGNALEKWLKTNGLIEVIRTQRTRANKPLSKQEIKDAVDNLESRLKQMDFKNEFELKSISSDQVLKTNKDHTVKLSKKDKPRKFKLSDYSINLYFGRNYGPEKAYMTFEQSGEKQLDVIINTQHPYACEVENRTQYFEMCMFDALSYWKALKAERVNALTIIDGKDGLLKAELVELD